VRQNLLISKSGGSPQDRDATGRASLEQVGLDPEIMDHYPTRLSIGMRKRVELVRALSAQTHLVLADEPFAALDAGSAGLTRRWLLERIRDFDSALVVASHDLREILTYVRRLAVFANSSSGERGAVTILNNEVIGYDSSDKRVEEFRYEVAKMIGAI
jgi:ABC-type nitrate/sulfonate/bicarbonate transport system ATPase subunit